LFFLFWFLFFNRQYGYATSWFLLFYHLTGKK
jgi:hypothetical protein